MRVAPEPVKPKRALAAWAALVMGAGVLGCAPAAPRIEIDRSGPARAGGFDVVGLGPAELAEFRRLAPQRQAAVFQVFVVADLKHPPPIVGSTSVEGQVLRFTPRFALEPAVRYRAVLHLDQLAGAGKAAGGDIVREFEIARPAAGAPTVVARIFPSADRLPENQLKFYLHFSAPMGRGDAYGHIHLLDADGTEIDRAFLELGEELWDRKLERFTLLVDPGRIKRGLKPREDLGPVLEAGKTYTLAIDRDWRDAGGTPLGGDARKTFQASAADDEPVDPAAWKIEPPRAGGSDALVVRFGEPLDSALVERLVYVTDAAGQRLAGAVEIAEQETLWRFKPSRPWTAGDYRVVAGTALEDLAGNSIGRAFDVDQFGPVSERIQSATISIPFKVRQ